MGQAAQLAFVLKATLAANEAAKTLAEQPHTTSASAAAFALVQLSGIEAGRRAVVTALTCVRGAVPALADLMKVSPPWHPS